MQNIEQIVVPVDFHQHTQDLAAFAVNIASKLGAKITFLHLSRHFAEVAQYAADFHSTMITVDEELYTYARNKMDALLASVKRDYPDCDGVVLRGEAADGIVDFVKDRSNCLIVMGTHGAKGIEKILLGSVADQVLKRAACPILMFNPYRGERGYQITTPISEATQPV